RILGTGLRFNVARPPFNQKAMRQAFVAAIDRTRIVERAEYGFGIPSERLDPQGPRSARFQPDESERLLAGKTITLEALDTATAFIDVAMEIQRQLAALDIDVRIVPIKLSEARTRLSEVDVDFIFIPSPVPVEAVRYVYNTQGVDTLVASLSETVDES